jgi:hypothetical protein
LLLAFGTSYALAQTFADIDPGECDTSFGDFEDVNAHVATNANWIIAECHLKLGSQPFREAWQEWDFPCFVGLDDEQSGIEDIEAFFSHLVFTPAGNLNIVCVAEFPQGG